jgi:UDP-2,3-diacylglucosamine hydrolase
VNAATLFVADLHLDPEARPETVALFLRFLAGHARGAAHLYILGDLFEVWIGDDDDAPGHGPILDGLRDLVASGVPAGFMTGNRDFLAGTRFTERSGCGLLADPTVIELGGVRTLLTHGDRLCIDDAGHMRFREMVDSSDFRDDFLARPLDERRATARSMRRESEAYKRVAAPEIMDVNDSAVQEALEAHEAALMIHGHTHRPALHGDPLQRAVLGDWHPDDARLLRCTPQGRMELLRLHADLDLEVLASAPLPGPAARD